VGDISTEEPVHGGLTAFGKDVVRACNKLGILVDAAHCTTAGLEQVLELSSKPVVHSHGFISRGAPSASQGGILARAIYAPLAKRLAEKGGVIGLQPVPLLYQNLEIYANELARLAEAYGAKHVGIGTDMIGLAKSTIPSYAEYLPLPDLLAKRGMKPDEVEAVMGGNYVRVLREALAV
jgi:membrane dipeptidase